MRPIPTLTVYLLLFGIAIPWYWQFLPIPNNGLLFGMPIWAFGSTLASLLISLFSGWILLGRWECEDQPDADGRDSA